MTVGTLQDIRTKIRRLTVSANSFQLTDPQIDDYIDSFYKYDFPAQFRSLKLKDKYTFDTIRGIDTYPFDSEKYITVEMPCYCAKREIKLFNDPWSFYGVNFNWQQIENFATGSAALGVGPYTGFAQATPIIRSVNNNPVTNPNQISRVQNILITANNSLGVTQNITDDGNGVLIGDGTGTIDYETGAISVTFNVAVTPGNPIQIQYNPVTLAIPLSILFFQNQFTLRPVPDFGYTIELVAYRQASQALANPDNFYPELTEWWEVLAVGAAKKIYEDRLDTDGMALMSALLMEKYELAYTRTYAQMGKQRIATIYSDQLSYNYGSGMFGFGNTGAN